MTHEELQICLETPCIVIESEIVRENLRQMQEMADLAHCALRPHIKTHKMVQFAKMQIECGAKGITCAKVSEAEVMADAGLEDIFIAYPAVGSFRVNRVVWLAKRVKRLIAAVDSCEGAERLHRCAKENNVVLEVRLELDTGAKRTGAVGAKALETAKFIKTLPFLNLTGIYTFKGLVYNNGSVEDNLLSGEEEGALLNAFAEELKRNNIFISEISGGSSPTAEAVAGTGVVTEIRPGTYIFKDAMLVMENAARPKDIAAHFYVTVVSTPTPEYAIIDGGTKTFPTDVPVMAPPYFYPGYAATDDDNLSLSRLNEEHGIITAKNGITGLEVGQLLRLTPIHICPAVNLQNTVYIKEGETLTRCKVDARGMLI